MIGVPHQNSPLVNRLPQRFLIIGLWMLVSQSQAQTTFELSQPSLHSVKHDSASQTLPTLHGFTDREFTLTWHLQSLPNAEVKLTGDVFAVGGPIAAPLPHFSFVLSGKLEPTSIRTFLTHTLPAPGGERPLTFLVRWQANVSNSTQALKGAVRIQLSPRGKLLSLGRVWLPAHEDLQTLRATLEADGVEVSTIADDESVEDGWQGVRIEWPADDSMDQPPLPKLEAGQVLIRPSKTYQTGQEWLISRSLGAGRFVRLPVSMLTHLAHDPTLQTLLIEACLPPDPTN